VAGAILATSLSGPRHLRATMLYWFAVFADRRGQTGEAVASLVECADLMRAEGDTSRVARSLNALGDIHARHGDHAQARASYAEALALMKDSSDPDDQH
jgi:Flp pilus assembly protein TadD